MGTAPISVSSQPSDGQRLFAAKVLAKCYGLPGAIGAWFADPSRQVLPQL